MRATLRSPCAGVLLPCAAALLVIAGCASAPPKTAARGSAAVTQPERDGAEINPPAGLDQVADAEPRLEPIRAGGPNKPYEALGRGYVPFTADRAFSERGLASWYGRKFQGRRTSSGEPYDMYAMTAAHPTLPIPSYARVRNPANGREVVVRVNDRGPFHSGRIIDLSYTAALKLDLLRGVAPVEVERITVDEIRAGSWRRGSAGDGLRMAAPGAAAAVAVPALPAAAPATLSADAAGAAEPTFVAARIEAAGIEPTGIEPTRTEARAGPDAAGARGFWVQLGAFRERSGAAAFQRRVAVELDWLSPLLSVFSDAALFRLQAGPYASRDQAKDAAEGIRAALQLVPVIVERR